MALNARQHIDRQRLYGAAAVLKRLDRPEEVHLRDCTVCAEMLASFVQQVEQNHTSDTNMSLYIAAGMLSGVL